ncbi:alternate-type signal peptide domain-containing protein [Actinomyces weissii]|uniref:Alternate-type signal peptide domain-containing protein n=1 Tax=Actinomyces weissii TaxID=675090 RepID=A0A7T7MA81_9ACTO|nr:alternate-type signal peptide domain-containing protein [Actinomyces weissii]QQM67773.1 alternate-type signal peptide domain-containing protein [Actinomyces weissii]
MSRTSRALIAGGAALALLAGSGATFARWYDEKTVTDASVTTGTLKIVDTDVKDKWLINAPEEGTEADPTKEFDPATETIVPGDVVSFTKKIKLDVKGKNLRAEFAVSAPASASPAIGKIKSEITNIDCVRADGVGSVNQGQITEADDGATCTVKVELIYPVGPHDNTGSAIPNGMGDGTHTDWSKADAEMGKGISVAGYALVLEQQARPADPAPAP